jgi:membrane-associated phospholipid phosphatase
MHKFVARGGHYLTAVGSAIRSDLVLYVVVLVYLLIATAYLLRMGHTGIVDYNIYATGCVALICVVLPYAMLILGAARVAFASEGRRSLAWRTLFSPRRVARGVAGTLLMLVLLLLFEAMYISVKTTFSAGGFPFDPLIADIDRALHFGRAPGHWLSFLRVDWLLRVVEFNYDAIWFPFWLWTLYWFCVTPRAEALRVRFVLTFTLAWALVGNVVAGMAVTAGPALYGLATGNHKRFAPLNDFLQSTPNTTEATQAYLWAMHEAGTGGLGSGISAFPSMHVAVTTVCALFLSELDKRLRIPAWSYVAIICVSSVYLGWHYAVDGYAAILLTVGIYWAVRAAPQLGRLRFRMRTARVPVPALAQADGALP